MKTLTSFYLHPTVYLDFYRHFTLKNHQFLPRSWGEKNAVERDTKPEKKQARPGCLLALNMAYPHIHRKRRYPKRPLMGPTLQKTATKLPDLWEKSVK